MFYKLKKWWKLGSDSALQSGFGGGLLGAGVSAATGGNGNNVGIGAAVGAVAESLQIQWNRYLLYYGIDVEIRPYSVTLNEK